MIWKTKYRSLDLSDRAVVMGILNVTPDSFSDGGTHSGFQPALRHARAMIADGAEIIDIGGESTRPGADPVPIPVELARTLPVIAALREIWSGLISIDTMKPEVAASALAAGADIVNDVNGLRDPRMAEVCAAAGCGVIVMHMRGEPRTMQKDPHYDDVVDELREFFHERLDSLVAAGISRESICFDPGIGFGKNLTHNLEILRSLDSLTPDDRPLLLGISRKSFMGRILGNDDLAVREWATVALTAEARTRGVMLHRVHAVRENLDALKMIEAILNAGHAVQ
jgi:dihydropteroate synthase